MMKLRFEGEEEYIFMLRSTGCSKYADKNKSDLGSELVLLQVRRNFCTWKTTLDFNIPHIIALTLTGVHESGN